MTHKDTHSITFFPLGNADTTRIDLANGRKILFDYADMRNPADKDDKRIDLPKLLKEDLKEAKKTSYDVVAFTHLDDDHTRGAEEFFWFQAHQGSEKIKIETMWVPAALIVESRNNLEPSARAVQAEARHRFKEGKDIIVFSRPGRLKDWCEQNGIDFDSKQGILYDAGQVAPGFDIEVDGLEFFIHAPLGHVQDKRVDVDRNNDSLVMQALFKVQGVETSVLLTSDAKLDALSAIVGATKKYGRQHRLISHIYKVPHHCSYHSVGVDKGEDKTIPHPDVKWLLEVQGQKGMIQVISSEPIPEKGSKEDIDIQPPHREAYAYYKDANALKAGEIEVMMEFPNEVDPKPLKIVIGALRGRIERAVVSSAGYATTHRGSRAGCYPDQ
jgi:beta-lactamase superfamily II metal-dependent hydrolase